MNRRFFKVLVDCIKKNRIAFWLFVTVNLLNSAVFLLYRLTAEPFFYSLAISAAALILFFTIDFAIELKRAKHRKIRLLSIISSWSSLPEPDTLTDADYSDMISALGAEVIRKSSEFDLERKDMTDYYTAWVHQIKTPIAVMKMIINPNTDEGQALSAELFRIEQYVEMVLAYIRLDSGTNDLLIEKYPLDLLIKDVIRKYAQQFIQKKIRAEYTPTDEYIVTDRKWFCTVIEQLVSNAIKYTRSGSVRITVESGKVSVSDSGIGIAAEDIPRIFEKGYTGANGRIGEASSGLGLYLAKRAADKLSLKLSAESKLGVGSIFTVEFKSDAP